jgi:uncharacterized protein YjcR
MSYDAKMKEKAKARYLEGYDFSQIAREVGCKPATVKRWSRKEDWPKEKAKMRAEAGSRAVQLYAILMSDQTAQKINGYHEMVVKALKRMAQPDKESVDKGHELFNTAIEGNKAIEQDCRRVRFLFELALGIEIKDL